MSTEAGPVVDARPLTGQESRSWELGLPMSTDGHYGALFRKAAELCDLASPDSVDVTGLWFDADTDELRLGLVLHRTPDL